MYFKADPSSHSHVQISQSQSYTTPSRHKLFVSSLAVVMAVHFRLLLVVISVVIHVADCRHFDWLSAHCCEPAAAEICSIFHSTVVALVVVRNRKYFLGGTFVHIFDCSFLW